MPGYEIFWEKEGISNQNNPIEIYVRKIANLRKVAEEELEFVKPLFEAAKRTMDQIGDQIREACDKFEATTATKITDLYEEAKIEELRKEVRTLKYNIPNNLIYPPPSKQLNSVDHPNIVWHPRTINSNNVGGYHTSMDKTYSLSHHPDPLTSSLENMDLKLAECNPNFYFLHHPTAPANPSRDYLSKQLPWLLNDECCSQIFKCLRCFRPNVIIKRTLLFNCFQSLSESPSLGSENFDDGINKLEATGFLKAICKRSTLSVSSYWIPKSPNIFLGRFFHRDVDYSIHFSPLPSDEQEVFYIKNPVGVNRTKCIKAVLLGKWHRSLSLSQHIEVADPKLFYKSMESLTEVRYIGLRGISMIPELPQFITRLKKLQMLDCKACHDLEVIPRNINKLWRTLTHLDISDCYLLDHMPTTLSDLVHLQVLKGFPLGEPDQRKSCTLRNLTKLSKLQKLHICTSIKGFPNTDHLTNLQKFESLRNLGISWRGCYTTEESTTMSTTGQRVPKHEGSTRHGGGDQHQQFSLNLEKLDLRCVPNTVTRVWLNPFAFKGLKKLYIRGGSFCDLGQMLDEPKEEDTPVIAEDKQWTVELLRLKYLRELKIDKRELNNLFPELITLEKVDCPKLTSICCDDHGIWIKSTHLPPTASLGKMTSRDGEVTGTSNSIYWNRTSELRLCDDDAIYLLRRLEVAEKIKRFFWEVLQGNLQVSLALKKSKWDGDTICQLCYDAFESDIHLLKECVFAKMVWKASPISFVDISMNVNSVTDWWMHLCELIENDSEKDRILGIFVQCCWEIWRSRNDKVFNDIRRSPLHVSAKSVANFYEFSETLRVARSSTVSERPSDFPDETSPIPMESSDVLNALILIDAATDRVRINGGLGIVFKNNN